MTQFCSPTKFRSGAACLRIVSIHPQSLQAEACVSLCSLSEFSWRKILSLTHWLFFSAFMQKPAKKISHAEFISASLFDKFHHQMPKQVRNDTILSPEQGSAPVQLACKLFILSKWKSMFFLFRVKGIFLFLITKKEKYPLKPHCSLNNNNVLSPACSANCPLHKIVPKLWTKFSSIADKIGKLSPDHRKVFVPRIKSHLIACHRQANCHLSNRKV